MFFTVSRMDSRKPVLLGSLLLLIFSQILVEGAKSHILMDMALHSFDDQYLGCREEMMQELEQGDYFQKEIAANKDYLSLWKKAQEALLKSPVGLLREMRDSHAIALMAYTMHSSLHSQLNWATSTAGISLEHYRHKFSFKYFHFYLTTAIQIMKEWQSSTGKHKCYQVHRGVKDLYIKAMVGSRVRFGRFTSTSCLRNEAQKFGNETLFTVTTCLGAAMQGFSYYTPEKEVLIPPYEIFLVKNFFRTQQGNRLHLHSVGNYSKYHCQLVEGIVYSLSSKGGAGQSGLHYFKQPSPVAPVWGHTQGQTCSLPAVFAYESPMTQIYQFAVKPGTTPHSLKMNPPVTQHISRFFAASTYPMCHCKDVVGLVPLGPKHSYCKASRNKNSGYPALASAILPSVLGVSLCLAHNL